MRSTRTLGERFAEIAAAGPGGCRLALRLAALAARSRRHRLSLPQRLAQLPTTGLPVAEPVTVRWSPRHIPFIEAASDHDLSVGLGAVHAHLRLAQMEMMRRVAQGRLAELLGPPAVPIDRGLRLLDLTRAIPAVAAALPEATRAWLEGFVAGINHVVERAPQPPDLAALGAPRQPWSLPDVLGLGRLVAVDMNWKMLLGALKLYGTADWPEVWAQLVEGVELPDAEELTDLATGFIHSGSNAVAVAGRRTGDKGALLAADPHLDLVLPNFWLLGGLRSPSFEAVGLMIPGLPFIALGRNRWIGWTGTSLQAASTDLFDAEGEQVSVREESVVIRWMGPRRIALRETRLGPLISDVLSMPGWGKPVALHWMGHLPSDEFTAMLRLNRARNWKEFVDAAAGFAVPGESFLYGDAEGHIGGCLAVALPLRPPGSQGDLLSPPADLRYWDHFIRAKELPRDYDPPEGFLVSANLPPAGAPVAVTHFHSPNYRHRRLAELLRARDWVTVDDLARLQQDVLAAPDLEMRDWLLLLLGRCGGGGRGRCQWLLRTLSGWDGRYDIDSVGAAAYEILIFHLLRLLEGGAMRRRLAATWDPPAIIRGRLRGMKRAEAARLVGKAFTRTARSLRRPQPWGRLHHLRLPHLLGSLPIVGRLFHYADIPWPGGNETVMKSSHGAAGGRHHPHYGTNARLITDLSDLDSTHAILAGGQDGWLGSSTFLDQLDLWRSNHYVQLPLRPDSVARLFPLVTIFTAGA